MISVCWLNDIGGGIAIATIFRKDIFNFLKLWKL